MKKAILFTLCALLLLPIINAVSVDRGFIYALAEETESDVDGTEGSEITGKFLKNPLKSAPGFAII